MALPVRPTGNGAPKLPTAPTPDLGAMPDLSGASLPPMPEPTPAAAPILPAAPAPRKVRPVEAAPKPKPTVEVEDGWEVDSETGKKFKRLPGYSLGVMKQSKAIIKAGGLDLDQLRKAVGEDPDLNVDDLNGSAEMFLSHLRVPLDREEQLRLRKERAVRQRAYDEANSRVVEEEDDEEVDE